MMHINFMREGGRKENRDVVSVWLQHFSSLGVPLWCGGLRIQLCHSVRTLNPNWVLEFTSP